jgi:hypothetical protein
MNTQHWRGATLLILCCSLSAGCANLNFLKPLSASTPITEDQTYVYGSFALNRTGILLTRVLLRIEDVNSGATGEVELREIGKVVYAVALPPGKYRVKEFVFTKGGPPSMLEASDAVPFAIPPEAIYLAEPVQMLSGTAYYLGNFHGECDADVFAMERGATVNRYWGKAGKITQQFVETTAELRRLYPAFASVNCLPAYPKRQ